MNPILLDFLKKTLVTGIISGCVYLFFESPVTTTSPLATQKVPTGTPTGRGSFREAIGTSTGAPVLKGDKPPSGWSNALGHQGVEKITHREELQLILLDEETEEENPNLIYPTLRKEK